MLGAIGRRRAAGIVEIREPVVIVVHAVGALERRQTGGRRSAAREARLDEAQRRAAIAGVQVAIVAILDRSDDTVTTARDLAEDHRGGGELAEAKRDATDTGGHHGRAADAVDAHREIVGREPVGHEDDQRVGAARQQARLVGHEVGRERHLAVADAPDPQLIDAEPGRVLDGHAHARDVVTNDGVAARREHHARREEDAADHRRSHVPRLPEGRTVVVSLDTAIAVNVAPATAPPTTVQNHHFL